MAPGEAAAIATATAAANGEMHPHILAFPFPIPGHMNPLMHLCRRLASLGFKITFATNQETHQLMRKTWELTTIDKEAVLDFNLVSLDDGLPKIFNKGKSNPSENIEQPLRSAHGMKDPLIELIRNSNEQNHPVCCIISDTFMGWIQDVANIFNIPRVAFWTSSAINDIIHTHLPQLVSAGFVPVANRKTGDELITFLPGIPALHPTDLPLSFYYEHPLVEVVSDGARRFSEAAWVLANTFEELEPEIVNVVRTEMKKNYLPVGPCLPPVFFTDEAAGKSKLSELSGEDLKCIQWLDKQAISSVIYVSFGSVAVMSAKQIEELVLGLEKSMLPFLLVMRKTLIVSSTADETAFLDEFMERTKDRGIVVSWAPQMQVLLHQAVGGFLTHCGWNSTIEGISAGVPLLGWPCMAEQNVNCRDLVDQWKIAMEVKAKENEIVSSSTVKELVEKLMIGEEGKELREKVRDLKNAARKAVIDGSSHCNLLTFAKALKGVD